MSDVLDLAREAIPVDASPDTVEQWDSLSHMNLVLALEEEFGVQFPDEQIVEMLSIDRIVAAVEAAAKGG
jgi:acyl carrier protein